MTAARKLADLTLEELRAELAASEDRIVDRVESRLRRQRPKGQRRLRTPAHPETAKAARAAGLRAIDHPLIERGQLLAVKPYEPPPLFSPLPRSFR